MKSYAISFLCKNADGSRSNSFRVYDFEKEKTAGECYGKALEIIMAEGSEIVSAVIVNMVPIV